MLSYRGPQGYWAWLLHRVSGVAVLLFLFLHILDTTLVAFGPGIYNEAVGLYRVPLFRVLEVALVGAVLYHALNGLRVMVIDFWSGATELERQLWYAVWVLFVLTFVPAAFLMLRPLFAGRG